MSKEDIISSPVINEDNSHILNTEDVHNVSIRSALYDQFSTQNLKVTQAVLTNKEKINYMEIMVDNQSYNVNILNIAKDGKCLFSALVQQLQFVENNTNQHAMLTADLRENVVQYI